MKKLLFLTFSILFYSSAFALESNCNAADQRPIELMQAELKRGLKTFKKQKPPIYYLSYTYTDTTKYDLWVNANGIAEEQPNHQRYLEVSARAGSEKMDNTRTLSNGARADYVRSYGRIPAPEGEDTLAFRRYLWDLTQQAAERAQSDFDRVYADSQTSAQRTDNSNDFVFPPKASYCRKQELQAMDTVRIREMLIRLSNITRGHKEVTGTTFDFSMTQGTRYFVDTVGSQIVTPFLRIHLSYNFSSRTADGAELKRGKTYNVIHEENLPEEQTLRRDMEQSLRELNELLLAPEAEPVTVPAILKNRAMAVFVHEVLGHRMEGHRQKLESFGKTFTGKIGQPVTAPFITIVDDATLPFFNDEPLRGFYEYDDEGVQVRPVILVENGILREFLMSSSPIEGFAVSNGHGRRQLGQSPVARMGVTRLIASQTVPYEELEKQLIEEVKRQGKPYGYVIDDLSGGFTMTGTSLPQSFKLEPLYVYRIYPDGRKEVVRGADMVGTPLVSFSKIKAAADDYAVFNGSCGAESGWVPVSSIAPSVLLEALEIEKTAKSPAKPPILPAPMAILKEKKK